MNKKEIEGILIKVGSKIAEKYGFENIEIGTDKQKGIWGEEFTKFLEKEYGECTLEIKWYDNMKTSYIWYRHCFISPCLCIRLQNDSLCEIEFDNYNINIKKYDGIYKFSRLTVFKSEGFILMKEIISRLKEYGIIINTEIYD